MARLILFIFLTLSLIWAQDPLQGIREFLQREGYVVKVEAQRVLIDLGKDRARKGEEFYILREGADIVHPVTKRVIGKEVQKVGRLVVEDVQDGFSHAKVLEGSPKEGDRIRLRAEEICFDGSDEWYFKLSSVIENLQKKKECTYAIREFKDGIGVEFRGSPLTYVAFPKQVPASIGGRVSPEDISLLAKPRLLKALPSVPSSADLCEFVSGKEFLVVLYSNRIEVYELLKNDLVKRSEYSLPAGVGVGVQCAKISPNLEYLLVNMVSGDSPSSIVMKAVGDTLAVVQRNIPYFLSVLDKRRPTETFVGQRFSFRDRFGQTVRLSFEGERIKEVGAFLPPRGFRVDSAFYYNDYLVFTDTLGRVRVFRGDGEVLSTEEGFGGSYNFIEIPLEQGRLNFVLNPKGSVVKFLDFQFALVIKNHAGMAQRFFDILKYNRGELFLIGERRKDLLFVKPLRGGTLEEAVQAVLTTRDGRILVITGKTGTLTIQNRGEVYELELKLL
ncbi:MAG: hypothetical protein D6674_01260 [Acidobacteria bacterium]|nr:MAG: hypothetical protein D6674_01260 [Acidobacteriota bacterium]